MFESIEREIDLECSKCKKQCAEHKCVVYRIKQIIYSDIEVSDIDIDRFFQKDNQISFFD